MSLGIGYVKLFGRNVGRLPVMNSIDATLGQSSANGLSRLNSDDNCLIGPVSL